jgi:hypothetical protein
MAGYTGDLGDDGMGDADLDLVDSLVEPGFASLDQELDALLPSALEPTAVGQSGSPAVTAAGLLAHPHESAVHVGQPLAHMVSMSFVSRSPRRRSDQRGCCGNEQPSQGLPVPSVFAKMVGAVRSKLATR